MEGGEVITLTVLSKNRKLFLNKNRNKQKIKYLLLFIVYKDMFF